MRCSLGDGETSVLTAETTLTPLLSTMIVPFWSRNAQHESSGLWLQDAQVHRLMPGISGIGDIMSFCGWDEVS